MHNLEGGETGTDDQLAAAGMSGVGPGSSAATCSVRSAAPGPTTNGRAGGARKPPYHVPTFVLTHHARAPIKMKGGTEFRFVTDGIHAALKQARAAAGERDIRIGGGVSTIRQSCARIDRRAAPGHPAGAARRGEALWTGIDLPALGYEAVKHVAGDRAMHVFLKRA